MKMPYVDEYISKFEELCCKSAHMTRNTKVTYMFFRGLPKALLEDVLKALQAVDYPATKERVIQATRTQQLLQNILQQHPQSNQTGQTYRPPFITIVKSKATEFHTIKSRNTEFNSFYV